MRVQIIAPHKDLLLARRNGERPNASHDVADHLTRLELVNKSSVLGLQATVPVHTGVIESKLAILFVLNNIQIIFTNKHLEWESSELALRANIFNLVDDGANGGIFVSQNLGNKELIREKLLAEVEVC
jgi:hypothetical protein